MNNNTLEKWIAEIIACLRYIHKGDNADRIEEMWLQHNDRSLPVVTIYGTWDSGKSSLLKRLLVDDGKSVPKWLTVSARPETFVVNEVDAFNCTFVDTPGIGGGQQDHQVRAKNRLALSDAFIILVLPTRSSSEDEIVPILTGDFFRQGIQEPFICDSIQLVISRMDEAGIEEPEDNSEAYNSLIQRKKQELQRLLDRKKVNQKYLQIHAIAADPYGEISNQEQVSRIDYDQYRNWDGISELEDGIKMISTQLPQLRCKTALRYFSLHGEQALQTIEREKLRYQTAVDECQNQVEWLSLLERELDNFIESAKVDLDRDIQECLDDVLNIGYVDFKKAAEAFEPRLEQTCSSWESKKNNALEKLVKKANEELKDSQQRPAARMLSALLKDIPQSKSSDRKQGVNYFSLALSGGKAVFLTERNLQIKALHELDNECKKALLGLGLQSLEDLDKICKAPKEDNKDLTLSELSEQLKIWKTAEGDSDVYSQLGGSLTEEQINLLSKFKDSEMLNKLTELSQEQIGQADELLTKLSEINVKVSGIGLSLLIIPVAQFFWQTFQENKAKNERKQYKNEIREQLSHATNIFSKDYFMEWEKRIHDFRKTIQEKQSKHEDNINFIEKEMKELKDYSEKLSQLLNNPLL